MKKGFIYIVILLNSFNALSNDSLKVYLNFGGSLNSYFAKSLKLSNDKFGFRGGITIEKQLPNKYFLSVLGWYQNTKITNLETKVYDTQYNEDVYVSTNIDLHRINVGCELNKQFGKFKIGINGGVSYIFKSKIDETITGGTGVTAINIYNKYIIYNEQGNSVYKVINPYVGLSASFDVFKFLSIKYENNIDVFKNPNNKHEFIQAFNIIHNTISINLKIK